ncbi:hypothetical protein FNF29_02961 [Cafeteria roenbergensis]|uniref:Polyhydroxybutyrate depolymerase n=1 Tax=Cafeteria roenbergensis TaxID=33653 RepID=A0A5A8CKE5_CAFRO|nr:hypothetical protein FNF29_02961 [Cafeteria roenbergensis]|eukprot:KAA0153573.1 hypothetical protein FNF29_02961 [Cafeteria roenbergensis]
MIRGLLALAAAASVVAVKPGADLPKVDVDMAEISVSGISSGAFMAVQMHISYSQMINGAGILAGGPYWCAQDNVALALTACMTDPELISPFYLEGIVRATALSGFADDTRHLANSRVWVMSARNDTVVDTGVVKAAADLYSAFLTDPSSQIEADYTHDGEHSQITVGYGNPCTTLGLPYINACGFDAAGAALKHLIRRELVPAVPGAAPQGTMTKFSQAAFVGALFTDAFGLQDSGYVYVPPQCEGQKNICALHVAFHGCEMTLDDIGQQFVYHSGHIPWADANGIIILFPQAKSNLLNPKGCWDWWAYTGTAYASNVGAQTLTVKRIMDSLSGQPLTPNTTLSDEDLSARLEAAYRRAPGAAEAAAALLSKRPNVTAQA